MSCVIRVIVVATTIDDKLVVAVYRVVQLMKLGVSSRTCPGSRVRNGSDVLTQCNACVHEASKRGPDRIGSSVIGSPRSGWSR